MKDYYAILEAPPDATPDQIREQYRFMIQAWHPDKFTNPTQKERAAAKAKDVNEAYDVLSSPARRAYYDRSRLTDNSSQTTYAGTVRYGANDERRLRDVESLQRALEEQRKQADQDAEYARLYAVQERQLRQKAEQAAKDAALKADEEQRRRRQAEHETHKAKQLVAAAQKLFILVLAVIVMLVFVGVIALLWYLSRAWFGL
jgi:curved DNA-binding protein CbpA